MYTSFNCFGLYFTFITCALLTITSYILEPVLGCLHRRRQHKSYAHLEWISNNSLQLHRMAYEQLGGPEWANCTDDIPTTDPELSLASLDISDPSHPILRRPEARKGKTEVVESSTIPANSSSPSPNGGSFRSESETHLSGRASRSSTTSDTDESWGLDASTAIMNVSGQSSVEECGHGDARRDMLNSADTGGQAETTS